MTTSDETGRHHRRSSSNGGGGRRARRVGIGIADQLLYSASNFAMTVLVARSSSVHDFGAYSLVLASYLIFNVTVRGLTSETLVIRFSADDLPVWRRAAGAAAGSSLVLGVVGGVIFLVVGLFFDGVLAASLLILAATLPGLALQDHLRYSALSRGKPRVALANDTTQVVLQFAVAGLLIANDAATTPRLIAAWGCAAYVGALVGVLGLRLWPKVLSWWSWLRDNRDLATRYALDDLGAQVGQNGINYVLAGVTGLAGPAALRGAQTVFGPPSILNMGVQTAIMPEMVRTLRRSSRAMGRMARAIGGAMGVTGAVWGILALVCPTSYGRALFGPTWPLVDPLVIYFLVAQAANGLRMTPLVGLRALGAANRTLVVRVLAILIGLAAQLAGAIADGVHGVAVANAVAGPMILLVSWWQYRLALADHRRVVGQKRVQERWDELVESVPEDERIPALALWSHYE